ncbi:MULTISPECIES: hypothetical protein [unclassified Sphingomonas]|uniref:hypothetical protein n=1 Tax=unclassified Sphingomonas TaxID=196159 RepID=UPI001AD28378|nr:MULTISPECIES: hypothetical protein [unclassified Sphingomonas]MBN8848184.1 hypothetical protein [Sphingomonas sp.]
MVIARVNLADFMVTGRGAFPFDMLRYDECWPVDADAASALADDVGRRTVSLRTYRESNIHPARWDSFGWSVTRNPECR